jgi:1,5-anhydro-D-fructose reductase (1,5-anhydro-D-mannitol-forming)
MTIRWGIIGCGDVCERKSGPGFQKANGSALVAVMRRDRRLAEDFARRHSVPRWYDDADALVNDPEVDAVYIATPPGTHLEHALRACRARKPAYVEKPMARNYEECKKMTAAFEEAKTPLFVAYYRRALDRFRAAREMIESGRIGTVTGVRYRYSAQHAPHDTGNPPWRITAENGGGGLFLDLGSHTLDILDFLVGPLGSVSGLAANCASPYDVEDSVAMSFLTQSGAPGVAHWSFASEANAEAIEILGTDGQISTPTFGEDPLELSVRGKRETLAFPNPYHIQQPMIQTVVDALAGRGVCVSTGASGARTSAVMDQALASYYGTRSGAFWQAPEEWPGRRRSSPALPLRK